MRILSDTITAVLKQDYAETRDVVIITIPEQQGAVYYPETTLYLANGEGVFLDGISYANKLREVSSIKFSLGKAPDDATIALENVSLSLGFALLDFQRMLDGSKVIIKKLFKTSLGWEADTMFTGYVRDVRVDEMTIQLSVSSDMNRRGTSVAGRTITQRCLYRFNVNGSGIGPLCGWTLGQPGNSLSCDKGLDTSNGCQSHGNQHRFGGLPSFTTITNGNGYDSTGGGWGEGPGGTWCIFSDSWILIEKEGKKFWTKVRNVEEGYTLISIDKFGNFVPTQILKVVPAETSLLYTISTKLGYSISCSPTHPVMQDYSADSGVLANTLIPNDKVLVYDYEKHIHLYDEVEAIEKINTDSAVTMLELTKPYHLFIAGNTKKGALVSHNLKPHHTGPIDMPHGGIFT